MLTPKAALVLWGTFALGLVALFVTNVLVPFLENTARKSCILQGTSEQLISECLASVGSNPMWFYAEAIVLLVIILIALFGFAWVFISSSSSAK